MTTNERMVVDYSQTVNKFTTLGAYFLSKIDELVNKVIQFKIYSTIDFKSAYHQFPIPEKVKIYSAFEADCKL